MRLIKFVIVICIVGGVWYFFNDHLYRLVTGQGFFDSEFNDAMLSEPSVQGYESFLNKIETIHDFDQLAPHFTPSYSSHFYNRFSERPNAVAAAKDFYKLSSMEYVDLRRYIGGSKVTLSFIGISSAMKRKNNAGEGLIKCKVDMVSEYSKWLIETEVCQAVPDEQNLAAAENSELRSFLNEYRRKRMLREKSTN